MQSVKVTVSHRRVDTGHLNVLCRVVADTIAQAIFGKSTMVMSVTQHPPAAVRAAARSASHRPVLSLPARRRRFCDCKPAAASCGRCSSAVPQETSIAAQTGLEPAAQQREGRRGGGEFRGNRGWRWRRPRISCAESQQHRHCPDRQSPASSVRSGAETGRTSARNGAVIARISSGTARRRQDFRQDRRADRQDFRQGNVTRPEFRAERRDDRRDFRIDRRDDRQDFRQDRRGDRRDFRAGPAR